MKNESDCENQLFISAGIDTTLEDRDSKPKQEHRETVAEVRSDSYGRQLRLLVHGILELSEDLETSAAGNFSEAEIRRITASCAQGKGSLSGPFFLYSDM